eukprot:CAMPEP_0177306992 /NCGR_PEP_ID=MMETSP0368-20130122/8010_1 /TAXON_ID=447022 ORGANISM="Scrippsiella hangoei-like, Strain SHHI-4" /NCGR_SAMPLE_ID=MMETSP0368 /ASSEMBLY_ACC=CAM_ASM_000363 /LENGTH=115 /DNA_ID=CAMNT_0018765739 /DNA_START=136 /DNA_END=480 /DNA_ORIENTATION=+
MTDVASQTEAVPEACLTRDKIARHHPAPTWLRSQHEERYLLDAAETGPSPASLREGAERDQPLHALRCVFGVTPLYKSPGTQQGVPELCVNRSHPVDGKEGRPSDVWTNFARGIG